MAEIATINNHKPIESREEAFPLGFPQKKLKSHRLVRFQLVILSKWRMPVTFL